MRSVNFARFLQKTLYLHQFSIVNGAVTYSGIPFRCTISAGIIGLSSKLDPGIIVKNNPQIAAVVALVLAAPSLWLGLEALEMLPWSVNEWAVCIVNLKSRILFSLG